LSSTGKLLLAGLALFQTGCYVLKQAEGQLHVLLHLRPVEEVLRDPSVPDDTKAKLRRIQDIKQFGERHLGLTPSSNYTRFYDTQGRPITWLVSACRKDRFEPYTWWFPIVGRVPYKGFFRREDALDLALELIEAGYDVTLTPTAAYSTLGYFTDPILSTMLEYPEEQLASLILHELTHGTIFLPGGVDFNESLAGFVGWQGALEFARHTYGADAPEVRRVRQAIELEERRDARARELFAKLQELYRSDLPSPRKVELRDQVAGRRVNNAAILMQRRYGGFDRFREIFEKLGGDWRKFFESVKQNSVAEMLRRGGD
jgi:predicted aminopeptidase